MKLLKHFHLIKEHPSHFDLRDIRNKTDFKVAKSGLSAEHLDTIKNKLPKAMMLADGGKIDEEPTDESIMDEKESMDKDNREAMEEGADQTEYPKRIKDKMKKAKDMTPAQHLADGGITLDPKVMAGAVQAQMPQGEIPAVGPSGAVNAPADANAPFSMSNMSANPTAGLPDTATQGANGTAIPQDTTPAGNPSSGSAVPNSATAIGPTAQQAAGPAESLPQNPNIPGLNPMEEYNKGMGLQQAGITTGMKGEQQKAADLADAYSKQVKSMEDANKDYETRFKSLNDQGQKLFDYINDPANKVDPNRFWNQKSSGQRVIGAIALALGGIGQGITGHNPALEMINNSIQRDIDAQANDLSNKQNLLSQNLNKTRDLQQAKALTYAQLATTAAAQANQAGAKALDPEAKARAQTLSGNLMQQAAQAHMGMAANQAMMNMANQSGSNGPGDTDAMGKMINNLAVVDPERAKALQEKFVPGVGLAQVPVPEKARQEMIARQSLDQQIANLRAFAQKHEYSLDPAIINEGKALAGSVQDAYRRANGQGVFREAEAKFVGNMISEDPTAFFNKFRVDPKYKAVANSNLMELNAVKRGYGLKSSLPGTSQGGISFTPVGNQ